MSHIWRIIEMSCFRQLPANEMPTAPREWSWARRTALLDRGYGKSVAVSMDIVDEGQAHLEALQELADRRQLINREKTLGEGS